MILPTKGLSRELVSYMFRLVFGVCSRYSAHIGFLAQCPSFTGHISTCRNSCAVTAQSRVKDHGTCEPIERPGRRLALSVALLGVFNIASPSSTSADEDDEIDKFFPPLTPEGVVLPSSENGNRDVQTGLGTETVTDVVYLDIGVCPEGYRTDRTLGDKSALCTSADPLGRLVIGIALLKCMLYTGLFYTCYTPVTQLMLHEPLALACMHCLLILKACVCAYGFLQFGTHDMIL